MVQVTGQRWRIEQDFELTKGEVNIDHYEVRRWDGWYWHMHSMTVAILGVACLAVLRAHAAEAVGPPESPEPKRALDLAAALLPLPVPEIRHLLWALSGRGTNSRQRIAVLVWSN